MTQFSVSHVQDFLCWTQFSTDKNGKTKENGSIFYNINPISLATFHTRGERYQKFLSEPCAKVLQPVPKLSNKQFTNSFLFLFFVTPGLVHRPTAPAVSKEKNATRWRYGLPITNLTPHYNSQFCFSFIFVLIREIYKPVWMGPQQNFKM